MEINEKFLKAIDGPQNIVISTHSFPDADGIGSQIALCLAPEAEPTCYQVF